MASRINANDLTPAQRRQLGVRKPREQKFTMEHVRRHAIEVLSAISNLKQGERKRVLKHALKVNEL